MLEAHGVAAETRMLVGVRETDSGHIFIETKSISGAVLTVQEARYLASCITRLARRIEGRAA
jgi:hypothetical protein